MNNKLLDKKIEKVEGLISKEKEKIDAINLVLGNYEKELKQLYDYKKQQEKIYQMQQELDIKIKEYQS